MRLALVLLALPILAATRRADGQDLAQVYQDMGARTWQHPYLLFSNEEKPAILQRIHGDQHLSEIMEKTILEGQRYLSGSVSAEVPQRVVHSRLVGADPVLSFMDQHAKAATLLAFLYQMTGDTKYVQRAFEHADAVCGVESWVQSAHHFEIIYPRVWPIGVTDDKVVFSYDITAAGISRDLAYVYDWLYPALTKAQRDRIRGALLEKAITRVRGSYDYFWWANAYRCNWTGICYSGLGLAALALHDEDPNLTDVVEHSVKGVTAMLDHMGDDGAWQEGRGYWAYGLGESSMFIEAVRRASGGRIDLFHHQGTSPHPLDFALFGLTAGFGDGSGDPVGHSYFVNKLIAESKDPHGAWYKKTYLRDEDSIFDLIWTDPGVAPEKPSEASHYFRTIDWAVLRKDFGPSYLTVATKSGLNDDPHHGHLDAGTFNLTWQNATFIGEVPRAPYDEQYFGALRWEHLEASTHGHNVVMVNGEEQLCAKLKDQPWKEGVGGKILGYGSNPGWGYVAMDQTHAYPGKELKGWKRWIVLDKEHNVAVVLDRVATDPGATIDVRFHPAVAMENDDGVVVLHGRQLAAGERQAHTKAGGKRKGARPDELASPEAPPATSSDMAMITVSATPHSLIIGREADVPYTEDDTSTWVPYYSTRLKAASPVTWVASVFVADSKRNLPAQVAPALVTTGDRPRLSYSIDGKTLSFGFSEDAVTSESP